MRATPPARPRERAGGRRAPAAGWGAWLFAAGSARRLLVVWAGLSVLIGLRIALGPYRALAGQPPALFRPPWFLSFLPGMPPLGVIAAVQVAGVAAAALAALGRRRREAFAAAWVALLLLGGLRTSLGKVLHNDVLLLLAAAPFLAAPADARPGDAPSVRFGWPVRAATLVVAGAYLFAGAAKLRHSGLAWVTSDNMRNVMYAAALDGRAWTASAARLVADRAWLATASAAFVLGLELTFPAVLWGGEATRRAYAAAALAFHAFTWLTLGIDYWLWAAVAPLVLVDWARPGPRPRPRL